MADAQQFFTRAASGSRQEKRPADAGYLWVVGCARFENMATNNHLVPLMAEAVSE